VSKPEGLGTFYRDYTFHGYRRLFGENIPATDIDFLEFDNHQPIAILEQKTQNSHWREGIRTDGLIAMWHLANKADIPLYVAENNLDWTRVAICAIGGFDETVPQIVENETVTDIRGLVRFQYDMRGRKVPLGVGMRLEEQGPGVCPGILTKPNLIIELFGELSRDEKTDVLEKLQEQV